MGERLRSIKAALLAFWGKPTSKEGEEYKVSGIHNGYAVRLGLSHAANAFHEFGRGH
jgi:hypothetical protein